MFALCYFSSQFVIFWSIHCFLVSWEDFFSTRHSILGSISIYELGEYEIGIDSLATPTDYPVSFPSEEEPSHQQSIISSADHTQYQKNVLFFNTESWLFTQDKDESVELNWLIIRPGINLVVREVWCVRYSEVRRMCKPRQSPEHFSPVLHKLD